MMHTFEHCIHFPAPGAEKRKRFQRTSAPLAITLAVLFASTVMGGSRQVVLRTQIPQFSF